MRRLLFVAAIEKMTVQKVLKKSAEILGVSREEMAKRITPRFTPIPIEYFLYLGFKYGCQADDG